MFAAAAPLWAARPLVQFDVDSVVSCRDVTTEEFALINPGEKLIEATLRVSTFMPPGEEETALEHLYAIESLCGTMLAVDYLPKSTFAPNVAGNLMVERKDEKMKTLGLTIKSTCDTFASGAATAGMDTKSGAIVKYEALPALEMVSASGLVRRGAGVYFKLKASPRHSLQGAKPFVVIFRVHEAWRGDYVHLRCEAWRTVSYKGRESVGLGNFFVALHLEGDSSAKVAAAQFVQSELAVRAAAARCDEEIQRRAAPTVAHQVGVFISLVRPKIPRNWLANVLYSSPYADQQDLLERLPPEVRSAAETYLAMRQQLLQLSAPGGLSVASAAATVDAAILDPAAKPGESADVNEPAAELRLER